jgi:hypothetical protein
MVFEKEGIEQLILHKTQVICVKRSIKDLQMIVSINILLIHELSHGLENANENAQIKFFVLF